MEANLIPAKVTVKVIVRHSWTCKDKARGSNWPRCRCPKSLWIYTGDGSGSSKRISAKTRSWSRAEQLAQEYRDSFDPEKQELKQLRAEKEHQQVRIEEAVALYCADLIARLGDNGTVKMARSLLGHVDPETKAVHSNGHLFDWLDRLPLTERPTYMADFTPAHLLKWRASWRFNDLTAAQRWGVVKAFFSFCEAQGWIADSPARKLKPPTVKRGNRTAIFTDAQYAAILDAVSLYDPENVPEATRRAWQQRLRAFLELMRWSGMDLIDAVQWRPESIDADGVLRYRRQKTGVLAVVPLPAHVIVLPRDIPMERDSVGPGQPFRTNDTDLNSDTRKWGHRLDGLFTLAGIKQARTELGTVRKPHPKMLRDTFAVYNLRHGVPLHSVSRMLGHSKTTTTEQAYLPWVKELETAHIAAVRDALAAAMPKPIKGRKVIGIASR